MCDAASPSSPAADFCSLADDVVLRILLFCSIDTLIACKRVSRPLQRLIDADVYLQYKVELELNGMVDGTDSCKMNVVEKLQLLRDYATQYHSATFAASRFKYSWQRWPEDETMPKTDWKALLGFGGSVAYVTIKPPQRQISVCAPPPFSGPREMQDWLVPYEALSSRSDLVVVSVSVDLSQDLLLVVVRGEGTCPLSIFLRSLDRPTEDHPHSSLPTVSVIVSNELGPAGDSTPDPFVPSVDSIQIHRNIIAWKVFDEPEPAYDDSTPGSCDIEVWDWRIGKSIWHSHYSFDASFTLLDDAHIVIASTERDDLVVESFNQWSPEEETQVPVLALGLPPQRGSVRIQESSIPSLRSPTEPFWTDPALRMVVVRLNADSALLIPYKTFLDHIPPTQMQPRKQATPGGHEPPLRRLAWEDWCTEAFLLVGAEKEYPDWSFEHCHSYGSRVVVNADEEELAVMFDLNPWAARNARRFPKPTRKYKAPEDLFGAQDATLPHGAVLQQWYDGMGLGQSAPGLATDPMGFTEVYSMDLESCRFLGSISHWV